VRYGSIAQFNKFTMSQSAPSTGGSGASSTTSSHTFLLGELQTSTSSDPPSPESASPTSEFDDVRLPANLTEKPVAGLGVGGEHNGKKFQEEVGRRASIPVRLEKIRGKEKYRLVMDDELRKLLVGGSVAGGKKRKKKFSDVCLGLYLFLLYEVRTKLIVFYSWFLRKGSPCSTTEVRRLLLLRFADFTLSSGTPTPPPPGRPTTNKLTSNRMSVVILVLKLAATSYREHGRLFGMDILSIMFNPNNLIDCLLVDATMFWGSALWCVPLQKAIAKDGISWERTGWIIQLVWEAVYLGIVIEYTLWKDWPWIQTVFIVLHCLVMLMKQHSYAFYNGHLSVVYKRLQSLGKKLAELRALDTHGSNVGHHFRTGGVDSGVDIRGGSEEKEELDSAQVEDFERAIMEEVAACNAELSSHVEDDKRPKVVYPQNLTWWNYFEYIHFPT